jgi:chorismate mutase / prephenate dehydratase
MCESDTNDKLHDIRDKIDNIDEQVLILLNKRATMAQEVAKIKNTTKDKSFYRPEREAQVLDKISILNKGPLKNEAARLVFRQIMSVCLALEKPMQIGFLGPIGTFTQSAAIKHFGNACKTIPYRSINSVFHAVATKQIDYGVVPIENSTEGVVTHTLDSFVDFPVNICAEVTVRVEHNLAISKNNSNNKINRIYSHQQSFAQCRSFIDEFYSNVEKISLSSNAAAAKILSNNKNSAAITSKTAIDLYDLKTIKENIEDNPNNTTRFLIIGTQQVSPSNNDKTSILISSKHQAGALYKLLKPLNTHKVDMTRIESRPLKSTVWQYLFFIDLKGHKEDKNVATALKELKKQSLMFKIIGSYPVAVL